MADRQERRQSKRFGVKGSSVQYAKGGGLLSWFSGKSEKFLVLDLSESGCQFMIPNALDVGARLTLTLEAPLIETPIKADGVVSWVKKSKEQEAYRIGVKFTKVSEAGRGRLRHIINNSILDKIDVTTTYYFKESNKL